MCVCQTRRKDLQDKAEDSDGNSSVCEELIEEPVQRDKPINEQTEDEDRFE